MSVSSRATASGIRVPMKTPPPAAKRPRFTSGSPKVAVSAATTTSQPSSSSKPPATAVALAAPTTGTDTPLRTNRPNTGAPSPLGLDPVVPSENPRRSIPAQKARSPVPVSTTQRTSGSSSASFRPRPISLISSALSEFRASGRLSLSSCTAPRRSLTSTGSLIESLPPPSGLGSVLASS